MENVQIGDPDWARMLDASMRTRTGYRPLDKDEIDQLIYLCLKRGIDPLLGHLVPIFRKDKHNPERSSVKFLSTIDAIRLVATRTGQAAGSDDPVYIESSNGRVIKATVTVYRMVDGVRCPTTRSAYLSEFLPPNPSETLWVTMPHVMTAKCAEASAWRAAFPEECGELYAQEEMDQARPDPRLEDPRYIELSEALKTAGIQGRVFAAYLKEELGESEYSKLDEEKQALALSMLKDGGVALWACGLTESVASFAKEKKISPAQLSTEVKERYQESALGKLTHAQRLDLYQLIETGKITPVAQEKKKPEVLTRAYKGQVARIDVEGKIGRIMLKVEHAERSLYFRLDALPAGMPPQADWAKLIDATVMTRCELIPKKSQPNVKMLVLRAIEQPQIEQETVTARVVASDEKADASGGIGLVIEGHQQYPEHVYSLSRPYETVAQWIGQTMRLTLRKTTAHLRIVAQAIALDQAPVDDIPSTAEEFRTTQEPPSAQVETQPITERKTVKVFSVTPPDEGDTRCLLMVIHQDGQSEMVVLGASFTQANAQGIVNATVLVDLESTTPHRTVTRIEMVTPASEPEKKQHRGNGASPEFRAKMESRLSERKACTEILRIAADQALTEQDLSGYCDIEYGVPFDKLPATAHTDLKEKLTSGEVTAFIVKIRAESYNVEGEQAHA